MELFALVISENCPVEYSVIEPHTRIFASLTFLEREYLDLVKDGRYYVKANKLHLKEDGEFEFIRLEMDVPV